MVDVHLQPPLQPQLSRSSMQLDFCNFLFVMVLAALYIYVLGDDDFVDVNQLIPLSYTYNTYIQLHNYGCKGTHKEKFGYRCQKHQLEAWSYAIFWSVSSITPRDYDGKVIPEEFSCVAICLRDTLGKEGVLKLISNLFKDNGFLTKGQSFPQMMGFFM